MKLSVTLTDERAKAQPYYASSNEREEYERVRVDGLAANAAVLAGLLRSIANEIDPPQNAVAQTGKTSWRLS